MDPPWANWSPPQLIQSRSNTHFNGFTHHVKFLDPADGPSLVGPHTQGEGPSCAEGGIGKECVTSIQRGPIFCVWLVKATWSLCRTKEFLAITPIHCTLEVSNFKCWISWLEVSTWTNQLAFFICFFIWYWLNYADRVFRPPNWQSQPSKEQTDEICGSWCMHAIHIIQQNLVPKSAA